MIKSRIVIEFILIKDDEILAENKRQMAFAYHRFKAGAGNLNIFLNEISGEPYYNMFKNKSVHFM